MKALKLTLQNFNGIEVLTKSQMKVIVGGDDGTLTYACGSNCTVAHCYGSYSNCTGNSYGNCDGGANCKEYCVVNGESQYWC